MTKQDTPNLSEKISQDHHHGNHHHGEKKFHGKDSPRAVIMNDCDVKQTQFVTTEDNIPLFLNKKESPKSVIKTHNITVVKGRKTILYPTSCTLTQGRTMVILGATGSGKDTFYNVLLGRKAISRGQLFLDENAISPLKNQHIQWRKYMKLGKKNPLPIIAFSQSMATLQKRPLGTVMRYIGDDVPEKIIRMTGIHDILKRSCKTVSRWQWVRVLLTKVMATNPLFFAIHWKNYGFLDGKQQEQFRLLLKQLQQDMGFGLIINTDDAMIARAMADDVTIFNRGVMEQTGDARTVYKTPCNQFVMEQFSDVPVNVFQGGLVGNSTLLLDNGLTLAVWGVSESDANKEICLCIRPDDFVQSARGAFVLDVAFVENHSSRKLVYGYLSLGNFKGTDDINTLICVQDSSHTDIVKGDTITLSVAQEKLFILDGKTRKPLNREL